MPRDRFTPGAVAEMENDTGYFYLLKALQDFPDRVAGFYRLLGKVVPGGRLVAPLCSTTRENIIFSHICIFFRTT